MKLTRVDLLRHGEPQGGKRYRGNGINDPLTENGWRQMRQSIGENGKWDIIYTSPLSRCQDFARELSGQRNIPVCVEPELKEVGFGDWEGKSQEYVRQTLAQQYQRFLQDPVNNRPLGAEPLAEFQARVSAVYQQILQDHSGQKILIVVHAGVIRAVLASLLLIPLQDMYKIKVDYAATIHMHHRSDQIELAHANGLKGLEQLLSDKP